MSEKEQIIINIENVISRFKNNKIDLYDFESQIKSEIADLGLSNFENEIKKDYGNYLKKLEKSYKGDMELTEINNDMINFYCYENTAREYGAYSAEASKAYHRVMDIFENEDNQLALEIKERIRDKNNGKEFYYSKEKFKEGEIDYNLTEYMIVQESLHIISNNLLDDILAKNTNGDEKIIKNNKITKSGLIALKKEVVDEKIKKNIKIPKKTKNKDNKGQER